MTYTQAHKAGPVGIRELEGYADDIQKMRDKLTVILSALDERGTHWEVGYCDEAIDCIRIALDHLDEGMGGIGRALGEVHDPDEDYDAKAEHGFGKAQYGLTR